MAKPRYERAGGRKTRAGAYSQSHPPLDDRDPETRARSFSGSGMSGPLPKPRSGISALGMYRPAPPRSGGKRYL